MSLFGFILLYFCCCNTLFDSIQQEDTFQLSFAKPFSLPEAQGEIVYELITADDIKASGRKLGEALEGERRWLAEQVEALG